MEKNLNINFIDNGSDKAVLKSMAIDEHHEYDKECLKNTLNSVEDLKKAMRDKSKLVQVERQISGKNGTFTRKYWVSSDQVKKTDRVVGQQQEASATDVKKTPDSISEENFPKGSKLYYRGKEATVVRVGREFSDGGMGIVVNFKSGGTGTIGKDDLKNVTKEAPKQQAVSNKLDEPQKSVTTKDIKDYSVETMIESNGEGSNGAVRTMMVKVGDNHWMKKMYDKKDNKWHVVPGASKTDIQTRKYFDKFGVKTVDSPKTFNSNSSKHDLSQMSESAPKDRMKQTTDRISKLSNDVKNNSKSKGQLNSVATDSQKKEYDELVAENGNLMIELGKQKKSTTDKKVVTKDDAKKSVQDHLKKNSGDKTKTIADFKSMGITWEEKEHPAINWMRANMAAQKFFMNQK